MRHRVNWISSSRVLAVLLACHALCLQACASMASTNSSQVPASAAESAARTMDQARLAGALGQWMHREQYLLLALEQGGDLVALTGDLVRVCVRAGRLARALQHVDSALEVTPRHWPMLALRAMLALEIGDVGAAHRSLEKARTLAPTGESPGLLAALRLRIEARRRGATAWREGGAT